jgi:hypothetical protein
VAYFIRYSIDSKPTIQLKPKTHIAFSFPARLILSFGIAFAGLTATSFAQSTWAGNTDANLATVANWDVLPTSGVSWTFGAAGTAGVTLANNLTASTVFAVSNSCNIDAAGNWPGRNLPGSNTYTSATTVSVRTLLLSGQLGG